jgi:DNA gyrase subunit B/topoisomerase-4 subunit B
VAFEDEATGQKDIYQHEEGLVDYLKKIVSEKNAKPVHEAPFTLEKENGVKLEFVVQWTESTEENLRSYVNGIPTGSGGTHENGLRAWSRQGGAQLHRDAQPLAERRDAHRRRYPRRHDRSPVDFPAGTAIPGTDEDRLNNPEVMSAVDGLVRPGLEHWLNNNQSIAEAIVARIILSARAREASRAAQAEVVRKGPTAGRVNLPGKLADCTGPGSITSELFVVEGDSAGGSAKQGRDRARQAILPLRGKVLNTEGVSTAKVLENKELADLVTALGCGVGKNFDLARMRYGKVIILADADSDGHHIATLLLTFIYRHLPQLITAGRVYLAQPPLYRIDIGKETHWALDEQQKEQIVRKAGRAHPEITRFKGLGEMMPKVLWETTLNPRTRRLLKVEIFDQLVTDRVINELMGKDASARFRFIMDRAEDAVELDV